MKLPTKTFDYPDILAPSPQLDWTNDAPVSQRYCDVYFSDSDGLQEARHVFLNGNELEKRWSQKDNFVIGELGFGSSLNFLATWQAWKKDPGKGFLHYLSVEAEPFSASDIKRAISHWPELSPFLTQLLEVLPETTIGFHRLTFFQDKITLTLCFGKAADVLPQISAKVDAWYLDGFAPSKNDELWNSEVFKQVARISVPGTTAATYSVARVVRDELSQVGFTVSKSAGHGLKREMLRAVRRGEVVLPPAALPKRVAVIGSGLAGANVAYSIAARGVAVTVFEKGKTISQGASGNPAGMVMPYMSVKPEAKMRLSFCGVARATSLLRQLQQSTETLLNSCGVLRLSTSERLISLFKRLEGEEALHKIAKPVSAKEASEIAGIAVADEAIYFPKGAIASPDKICRHLLFNEQLPIEVLTNCAVQRIEQVECGWNIHFSEDEIIHFDAVVIATGAEHIVAEDLSWITLEPVRGQIAYIEKAKQLANLKTALCYDGYVLPEFDGKHVVGATFEHGCSDPLPGKEQEQEVLDRLCSRLSIDKSSLQTAGGRVGFRASTPDRLPVVGAVPNREYFKMHYKPVSYSRLWLDFESDYFHKDLFISTGHASQGLTTTPIAAELIASQIFGEPLPLDKELVDQLNPARLLVRELNR